ncbi:hypothetical protein KR200_008179, partial [Drosophila serrata]
FIHRPDNIFVDLNEDVLRATDVLTQKGPEKHIRGDSDLIDWVRSQAYFDLTTYISNTSLAVQGYRLTGSFPVSEEMKRLCNMFDMLERPLNKQTDTSAASTPEVKNVSYRSWLKKMFHIVLEQLAGTISSQKCNHIYELGEYLRRAFGNPTTLDYGPGNELMFLFFLCGLFRAKILKGSDTVAAALMLSYRYIHLMRRLIAIYELPKVSNPRSVIEDYFFVPYLWGVAQLCIKAPFSPKQCDRTKEIESYRHDYMLVNLIENLPDKSGPLSYHAFQLWCLLSVPTWPEVYRGLERCYLNHILSSFHTVEIAIFWELMSFDPISVLGLLHRPVMGKRHPKGQDIGDDEDRDRTSEQPKEWSETSWPVRTYSSLNLFTGFQKQTKGSDDELDEDENGDRLAMLHPRTEGAAASANMNSARDSDSSNTN